MTRYFSLWTLGCCLLLCALTSRAQIKDQSADLLIVGGTESGWAAAIQAARMGVSNIVIVNDIEWLGGQFTAEAVSAVDENRGLDNKVPFPRSGLFKEFCDRIENFNLKKYGSKQPGNAWTAFTTFRPAEGEKVFREMLQPYIERQQVKLISSAYPVSALMSDDKNTLLGLTFRSNRAGDNSTFTIRAKLTIDASDWGDAVKLSGAEYEYGPDLKRKYSEPNAPETHEGYPITDMNPITYCVVIESTGKDSLIPKPPLYDDRSYWLTTSMTKADYQNLKWPFKPHRPFNAPWIPDAKAFYQGEQTVYTQRRLIDGLGLKINQPDVILLNWSIQDYPFDVLPQHVIDALEKTEKGASKKNVVQMTREQRHIIFEDAKRHSLGMFYHLQTTVHDRMPDKSHTFRNFKLTDEFGTADKLPPKPYIRESIRMQALYMMREQDGRHFNGPDEYAPIMYYDGVAPWQFVYDFHPTGRMFLPEEGAEGPWQCYLKKGRGWDTKSKRSLFPLRSLIPVRVDGLIGAQKNLGYSSIVSSAVRLQDQCILIGQASGATAAVALKRGIKPREIPFDNTFLSQVWEGLCARLDGGEPVMLWPFRDLETSHPNFIALNQLAIRQGLGLHRDEIDFKSDAPADTDWRVQVIRTNLYHRFFEKTIQTPQGDMTRAQYAQKVWDIVKDLPHRPLVRFSQKDADGDAIPDLVDANPFDDKNAGMPRQKAPGFVDAALAEPAVWRGVRTRSFNFTTADSVPVGGFLTDVGLPRTPQRMFGWTEDLSQNTRRRYLERESELDSFVFTRSKATWECAVPNGRYQVTICLGDASTEQPGQSATIEGVVLADNVSTAKGKYFQKTVTVEVKDEWLTLQIGSGVAGMNTCVNWMKIVPAE
jgi:hypothetical protein